VVPVRVKKTRQTNIPADNTTPSVKPRLNNGDEGGHFGEKDE
jgi:hypothetical protein